MGIFEYAFMQRALIASIIIGVLCSVIGVYVVLRGMSFIGAGIAHASFGGVALGYLLNVNPLFSAIVFSGLTALCIGKIARRKVIKEDTILIAPEGLLEKMQKHGYKNNNIITVKPNNQYSEKGIKFETMPAYNINKQFHPKENEWVGYVLELNNINYYIAGDTDITEENRKVKCDVAFVPVGGTYTMDYKEAAQLINEIKPKVAVPIHYGSVVGTKQDAENFIKMLLPIIEGKILLK